MQSNPYAPPLAEVTDLPVRQAAGSTPYFAVSLTKLAVMSLCTLGLYQLFWLYRQWCAERARTRQSLSPAARTFFGVLFGYALFRRVRKHPSGRAAGLQAGALAIGWILANLCFYLPPPYLLIGLANVLFLLPVQGAMNAVNEAVAPGSPPNARFTAWNWLAIVPGALLMALIAIGVLAGGR